MIELNKTILNLFNFHGMQLAAIQQQLMDTKEEDEERRNKLILMEVYYQGVLDALEGVLSLVEEKEKFGETDNSKYL